MIDAYPLLAADLTTVDQLLDAVEASIDERRPTVFVGTYPSLSLTYRASPSYRDVLRESRTYPDGTGVAWSMRLLGLAGVQRMPTTDVVWPVLQRAAERRWRVVVYGGRGDVATRAVAAMRARHSGLDVVATLDGYRQLGVGELAALRPDLVLVARGAPLQELWAHETAVAAGVPATLTCGGLLDFVSGDASRAPAWMRRTGLEWVYRVVREPRRLGWRYLAGNSLFVLWALRAVVRRATDRRPGAAR